MASACFCEGRGWKIFYISCPAINCPRKETNKIKTKKRTLKEYKTESKLLDKEFSGGLENTKPLTSKDKKWLHEIIESESPKIPVTIRLAAWQVKRAKQIAKEKHIRGYQTLIRQILTKALL